MEKPLFFSEKLFTTSGQTPKAGNNLGGTHTKDRPVPLIPDSGPTALRRFPFFIDLRKLLRVFDLFPPEESCGDN